MLSDTDVPAFGDIQRPNRLKNPKAALDGTEIKFLFFNEINWLVDSTD